MVENPAWQIVESSVTEVPDFNLDLLPVHAYEYISPRVVGSLSGNRVQLEAGPYVGTLPLTDGQVLQILPRAGLEAFWRLLVVSENLATELDKEFESFGALAHDEAGTGQWETLLCRTFFRKLVEIEKESRLPGRVRNHKRLESPRGKIKPVPTMLALSMRQAAPVHCVVSEKTFDTPENRVLAAAAARFLQIGLVQPADLAVAYRWADLLPGGFLRHGELVEVITGLHQRKYTGARAYYIPALLMARLVLADAGVALSGDFMVSTEALLVNMRTLFEKYVRSLLQQNLQNDGWIVEKREATALTLFEDGGCKLVPDVLVANNQGVKLIVDAKYKIDKPGDESDYYQMAAYMSAYGASSAVLVSPSAIANEPQLRTRRTHSFQFIHEAIVPLHDWKLTETWLPEQIRRLLAM